MNKKVDKAFTLVELLVAMGLFAAIMVIGVLVFRTAIHSQQAAARVADFMRDMGSITQLLSDDFSSVDSDAPFAIWFDKNGSSRIFVFATGSFEEITTGNLDLGGGLNSYIGLSYGIDGNILTRYFKPVGRQEDIIEHSTAANQRNILFNVLGNFIDWFDFSSELSSRVGSVRVQMLYPTTDGTLRWYPDENPYPLIDNDSDFDVMGKDSFGVFFNIDAGELNDFYPADELEIRLIDATGNLQAKTYFGQAYKPQALKFILTLTDAEGNLEDKTFTYVVEVKG